MIPDGGLAENLVESAVDLAGHQRRIGSILWHPTANNILASAGFDYVVSDTVNQDCLVNLARKAVVLMVIFACMYIAF